jgi:clan AA aspartic protease (TIGR02281 family)
MNTWILILLMLIFWVWFFGFAPLDTFKLTLESLRSNLSHVVGQAKNKQEPPKFALKAPKQDVCDLQFPEHGLKYKLAQHKHTIKQHGRVYVSNEHIYPILLTFLSNQVPYGAMIMHAKQGSELSLPIGQYQIQIEAGETWCNVHHGFDDGEYIATSAHLDVVSHQVARLKLLSIGNGHSDVLLSLSHALGVVPDDGNLHIEGSGSIQLQAVAGGHYAAHGSINQMPAYFLVDTGATHVSVSANFARQAGIKDCQSSLLMTANGVAKGCIGTASTLSIGQFTLHNVKVSYHDGLSDGVFLLGMNVISQFKMEQEGDVMRLSLQ